MWCNFAEGCFFFLLTKAHLIMSASDSSDEESVGSLADFIVSDSDDLSVRSDSGTEDNYPAFAPIDSDSEEDEQFESDEESEAECSMSVGNESDSDVEWIATVETSKKAAPEPPRLPPAKPIDDECNWPAAFLCPITQAVFIDPVATPEGHSFEREAIETWLATQATDPLTRKPLHPNQLYANRTLQEAVRQLRPFFDVRAK